MTRKNDPKRHTKISWQDIRSIGEFISGIAVVISLIYLAYQVKQNTIQIDRNTIAARSQGINSSISHTLDIRQAIFEDEEILRIFYLDNKDNQSLTEEERLKYRFILHNCIWKIWSTYAQVIYADLPSEIWDAQTTLVKRLLLTNGGVWFWTHFSDKFDPLFKKEIDNIIFPDGEKNV